MRLFGPATPLGSATAMATCACDQAVKLWLIFGFDLPAKGVVPVVPGVSLVMTWNRGISYGLFQQHSDLGRWTLLGITGIAVFILWVWLAHAGSRCTAIALGLILGGAIGNAVDRLAYGAVADFVLLHVTVGASTFHWYVFNLADAAIVVGVALVLYESLFSGRAAKAP